MKIDESVIDKVLDNKAAPGEARKVAGWFVTEEGRKYLSGRLDREMEELAEEMPEDVRLPSIPGMKMKQRFMSEIKRERGRRSVGRKWMWVAAAVTGLAVSFCISGEMSEMPRPVSISRLRPVPFSR